jgi:hypothetical protein
MSCPLEFSPVWLPNAALFSKAIREFPCQIQVTFFVIYTVLPCFCAFILESHYHFDLSHNLTPYTVPFIFYCVWLKTHKICPLNKCLSVQCCISYTYGVIQQISRSFSSCIAKTLYLFNSKSPFSTTPQPLAATLSSVFCFYEFDYFFLHS